MAKDLNIGKNAIITIEWDVRPIDFSREKEQNIIERELEEVAPLVWLGYTALFLAPVG